MTTEKTMEEFLAAVLARAAFMLFESLVVRLLHAFVPAVTPTAA